MEDNKMGKGVLDMNKSKDVPFGYGSDLTLENVEKLIEKLSGSHRVSDNLEAVEFCNTRNMYVVRSVYGLQLCGDKNCLNCSRYVMPDISFVESEASSPDMIAEIVPMEKKRGPRFTPKKKKRKK